MSLHYKKAFDLCHKNLLLFLKRTYDLYLFTLAHLHYKYFEIWIYHNNIICQWFAFYPLVCIPRSQNSLHFTGSPFRSSQITHHRQIDLPKPDLLKIESSVAENAVKNVYVVCV